MTASKGINRRAIGRWLGTAVGIGLLIYLLRNQGWDEILAAFRAIPAVDLGAAAFLILLSRFAVIGRWFLLLRSAQIGVSLARAARLTFAGLFASNFLPTTIGGDVVRLAEVANLQERRVGYAASLIVDRGIGMLGMATLLPFGLREAVILVPESIGSPLSLGGMAVFGRATSFAKRLRKQLARRGRELLGALRIWVHRPWGLAGALAATWGHMLCRFTAIWLLFRALGDGLGVLQIGSLWSLVYFVTLLPISINGLGVQELSTTFVFTELGGVSPSSALTIAILLRTMEMAASLPGALLLQGLLPSGTESETGSTTVEGPGAADLDDPSRRGLGVEAADAAQMVSPQGRSMAPKGAGGEEAGREGLGAGFRPLRILVFNYEFPPVGGGGGRASADLCRGLAAAGHDLRVVTTRVPGQPALERRHGYQVHRLWTGRRSRFQASFAVMASYVACGFGPGLRQGVGWKPDLIHAHFGVPTGALAYAVSRLTGTPYVLTAHLGDVPGGVPDKTDLWFRFVDPLTPPIWRNARRVVAVSEYTKRLVEQRYQVPSVVIPNGIDLDRLGPLPAHDPPRLIFAGRFQPQKNLPFLLEALAQVRDMSWQLQMLGDGPQRELLERRVDELGLADRVEFNGWVATEEVQRHLRASDLLVMPSIAEGLPVVAVQALAHGVAVAASEAGGLAEVVNHEVNGIRCPVGDLDCYIAALRHCLEDRSRLTAMKAASLKEAERYDLQRVTREYERVFQQAAGG